MARRNIGGAEGRRIKKEAEKQTNLKRKQNTRDERKMLIIACEDSVSAPLYFRAIFSDLIRNHAISAKSLVIPDHKHTNPTGVLQDLLSYPNYQDFDHKWIVIDRDEERTKVGSDNNKSGHALEDFNQSISNAHSNGIKVAYSNPCFEIWYLLHFEYTSAPIDRKQLVTQLEHKYQYAKNKLFVQVLNQELQDKAIKNSERLIQSWIEINGTTNFATDNPSTTVHDLVKLLKTFAN
jgi:RloB-like protein